MEASDVIWSHLESSGTLCEGHSGTLGPNLSGVGGDGTDFRASGAECVGYRGQPVDCRDSGAGSYFVACAMGVGSRVSGK